MTVKKFGPRWAQFVNQSKKNTIFKKKTRYPVTVPLEERRKDNSCHPRNQENQPSDTHQNNASSQILARTTQFMNTRNISHLLYNPDLAPNNFLLQCIKNREVNVFGH